MGARNGLVSFNIGPHIKSDASRAATYSKRKKGLLKKVKELSILCGVEVAVMCHHPQMAGTPPLLWGQPNLDSVLNRYKGVAPEEREKRKLDNTTFLHNQVQKLAADLHHLVDHNRKLADHLENSLWDDRLNSYSAADLQQVAGQVLRKKKEVTDLLESATSAVREGGCNQLMQEYNQLTDPALQIATSSSGFMLQRNHNDGIPGQDLLLQQLMSRVPAFRCSDNATMAAFVQSNLGSTPIAALCMSPPTPHVDVPAESENSIVSGRDEKYGEPGTPASSLMSLSDPQSVFTNKALSAVEPLDDEFGQIDIPAVDMAPAWYITGLASATSPSETSETYNQDANSHVKMPAFANDFFENWTEGISFASSTGLLQCQPNQSLQPEAGILVPRVN
ncbi:uncharacterized protein [Physcomitrium patens]|uniref:MADS-box domain-containing protein n=1 Tax=Physcomitrium patens TaxID=3218 RepID=A9RZK1_PHYPA|nr:MADS-box transcription factor 6-like [Physcomitrium patens]PNR42979.1 hypothetical protein PHYPA_017811 [Physcomitrium patens]|eukprot:XP_024392908.1 MADS-box transcription factor 6-like [Physcomitrella patens]